jgi:hypothetical protein
LTIVIAATTSLMITAGNSHAAPGQISAKLAEAEQKLAALGYWVIKADGAADASTRHANGVPKGEQLEAKRPARRQEDERLRLNGAAGTRKRDAAPGGGDLRCVPFCYRKEFKL